LHDASDTATTAKQNSLQHKRLPIVCIRCVDVWDAGIPKTGRSSLHPQDATFGCRAPDKFSMIVNRPFLSFGVKTPW
jgi:hypothetical protein